MNYIEKPDFNSLFNNIYKQNRAVQSQYVQTQYGGNGRITYLENDPSTYVNSIKASAELENIIFELDGTNLYLKQIKLKDSGTPTNYKITINYKIQSYTIDQTQFLVFKSGSKELKTKNLCKVYIQTKENINSELIHWILQKIAEAGLANNILCMYKNTYINFLIDFAETDTLISGKSYDKSTGYAILNKNEYSDRAQHILGRAYIYNDMIVHIHSLILPEDSNIYISECSKKNIREFINLLKALCINPPGLYFNPESEQRIFTFFMSVGQEDEKKGALYDNNFYNIMGQNKTKIKSISDINLDLMATIGKFIFIPSYTYTYDSSEKKHTQTKKIALYSIDENNQISKYIKQHTMTSRTTTNYIMKGPTPNDKYTTDIILLKPGTNTTDDAGYNIKYYKLTSSELTEEELMNDNFGKSDIGVSFNNKSQLKDFNLIINTHRTTLTNRELEYIRLIDILFSYK